MSWLDWFEGERPRLRHHGHLAATGEYTTHVEEAGAHQDAFEQIVGPPAAESTYFACTAFLVPEPDESFLPGRVAVHVAGCCVGYLREEHAELYHAFLEQTELKTVASCDALIEGGWVRGAEQCAFAVRLDLEWPLRLQE